MRAIRKNERYTTPPTNPPGRTSSNPVATRADSLAVYNSAVNLQKRMKDLGYDLSDIGPAVDQLMEDDMQDPSRSVFGLIKNNDGTYSVNPNFNPDLSGIRTMGSARRRFPLVPQGTSSITPTANPYQYNVTELLAHMGYNTDLPTALLDERIAPQGSSSYRLTPTNPHGYVADLANMLYYDPIAIAPTDLLTDDELKDRVSKYGDSGLSSKDKARINPRKTERIKPIKRRGLPSRPEPQLQVREKEPRDKLIDTQAVYRTPLSNKDNIRGNERPLMQTGVKKIYERPDGTRYVTKERFDREMIKELDELTNPAPRIIKAPSFKKGGIIPVKKIR